MSKLGWDKYLDRQVEARASQKELVCSYCGEPKGSKYSCCQENHFEEIELEVEDAENDCPQNQTG